MKLYNIRLPEELSYALKQAGADHVRQTLADAYGVDCKTTRSKPVPPKRKTTEERKTKEVIAVEGRKTIKAKTPPKELRVIAEGVKPPKEFLMPDPAFEAVEEAVKEKEGPAGDKYAEARRLAAEKLAAKKAAPKPITGITSQA